MALLWCDGFDHYGGDINNLTDGPWAEVGVNSTLGYTLSSSISRTGGYSARRGIGTPPFIMRRVLGGPKTTAGVGFALYLEKLPSANNERIVVQFRDFANIPNLSLIVQSTGTLSVFRGHETGTLLETTISPVIVANAFQYIEMQATFSNTVGAYEVRVNGVAVMTAGNVDTVSTSGAEEASQVAFPAGITGGLVGTSDTNWAAYYDDIYAYDTTGSFNNTFLGDRRVYTLYPSADTAVADWTPLSGNGWTNIDEGVDDDASYIAAGVPGSPAELVSEFDLQNLPVTTGFIAGIEITNRVRKLEAGIADFQTGIISNGAELEGQIHPINPVYTYERDIFEFDPDTGASFTPSAIDALQVRVKRVT